MAEFGNTRQGSGALPPGFTVEQRPSPQQGSAQLPPGFTLDAPAGGSDRAYLQTSPQAHAKPAYTGPVLSSDRPWTERLADFAGGVVDAARGQAAFDLPVLGQIGRGACRERVGQYV